MIQIISDTDNELYDDITNELYDQLSEIIERHELSERYKKHPTAKIIKDIVDALDKAGWVNPSKAEQIKAQKTTDQKREIKFVIKNLQEDPEVSIQCCLCGEKSSGRSPAVFLEGNNQPICKPCGSCRAPELEHMIELYWTDFYYKPVLPQREAPEANVKGDEDIPF